MGTIIAIGGFGEKTRMKELTMVMREAIRLSGKKKPHIMGIPTAGSDDSFSCDIMQTAFEKKLGCSVDILLLLDRKVPRKEIRRRVDKADIIFVGGGNTLMMMRRWRFLGVDTALRKAWKNGKILMGVSAGAICWFHSGVSDSLMYYNPKSKDYIQVKGLNVFDTIMTPYFSSQQHDKGLRTKGLKRMLKNAPTRTALCVEDGAGLLIRDDQCSVIRMQKKAKAWRAYWKDGYHQEEIAPGNSKQALQPF